VQCEASATALCLLPVVDGGAGRPAATWIVEVGVGASDGELEDTLAQGRQYAQWHFAAEEVVVCAVLVDRKRGAFRFAWERREASATAAWVALP
jgi:hypothetical protein